MLLDRTRLARSMTGLTQRFPAGERILAVVWERDNSGHAFARGSRFREKFSRRGGWQEWRDSNPRPSVLETDALPTELHSCGRERLYRPCVCLASNEVLGPSDARARAQADPHRVAADGVPERHLPDGRQPRRRGDLL